MALPQSSDCQRGSLSMAGLGATPFGYQVARQFGVKCDCATRASFSPIYLARKRQMLYRTFRRRFACPV